VLLTDRYNRLALSWWPKGAERQLPDHVLEVLEALCEAQWGQGPSSENRVFTCERLRDPLNANMPPLPLLAQMRSADRARKCLLFGVDRK
jgi:hypothetical protein